MEFLIFNFFLFFFTVLFHFILTFTGINFQTCEYPTPPSQHPTMMPKYHQHIEKRCQSRFSSPQYAISAFFPSFTNAYLYYLTDFVCPTPPPQRQMMVSNYCYNGPTVCLFFVFPSFSSLYLQLYMLNSLCMSNTTNTASNNAVQLPTMLLRISGPRYVFFISFFLLLLTLIYII